jgi:DNA-binding beta-propeller fold protein YncE
MKLASTVLALALAATTAPASAADPLYVLESAKVLPSTDTDWDYIKLEPHKARLFIARRKDGLTVFDVDTKRVVATVANSLGANGPLLLPEIDRGYVVTTDGAIVVFALRSLRVLGRVQLASDGGLNTVTYDRSSGHLQAVVGTRTAESTWFTLDPMTGRVLGQKVFPFKKMDEPAPDGKGSLFAPARYDHILMKLDSRTLAETARWDIGCEQVVAVEYQAHTDRLLIGCRGDKPVFLALDAATGRQIASIPIGKGIDGMAVDERRGRIVTSNGGDSSLTVIRQDGPDSYRLLGNVQTRPQARTMQIDERTGKLYLVTADMTTPVPGADGKAAAPYFHPNSFTVLTYKPM